MIPVDLLAVLAVVTLASTYAYLCILIVGTRRFDGRRNKQGLIIVLVGNVLFMLGAGLPIGIMWAVANKDTSLTSLAIAMMICGGAAACMGALYIGIKKPNTLKPNPRTRVSPPG